MFLLEIDEETIYACANMEAYLSGIEEGISFELNEVTLCNKTNKKYDCIKLVRVIL